MPPRRAGRGHGRTFGSSPDRSRATSSSPPPGPAARWSGPSGYRATARQEAAARSRRRPARAGAGSSPELRQRSPSAGGRGRARPGPAPARAPWRRPRSWSTRPRSVRDAAQARGRADSRARGRHRPGDDRAPDLRPSSRRSGTGRSGWPSQRARSLRAASAGTCPGRGGSMPRDRMEGLSWPSWPKLGTLPSTGSGRGRHFRFRVGSSDAVGRMIIGLGSDLIDTRRIERTLERFGTRFTERCFTDRSGSSRSGGCAGPNPTPGATPPRRPAPRRSARASATACSGATSGSSTCRAAGPPSSSPAGPPPASPRSPRPAPGQHRGQPHRRAAAGPGHRDHHSPAAALTGTALPSRWAPLVSPPLSLKPAGGRASAQVGRRRTKRIGQRPAATKTVGCASPW